VRSRPHTLSPVEYEKEKYMSWDINETLGLIENRHGSTQKRIVEPIFNSVTRKFEIARYHAFESKALIDKYFGDDIFQNYNKSIRFIFDRINKDEEALAFYKDAFISEAHIVAYSHAIHSVFDVIGQAIIDSLNVRQLFEGIRNIYFYTVKDILKAKGIASCITTSCEEVLQTKEFNYLRSFVNHNKHRCLVKIGHVVKMNSEEGHGIQIEDFDGFPSRWAQEFTIDDFKVLVERIIEIGNGINNDLK
jgi:hypothetical protein